MITASLIVVVTIVPAFSAEQRPDRSGLRLTAAPQVVSSGPLAERAKKIRGYWTKERMRRARPADRILGGTGAASLPTAIAMGEPTEIGPSAPEGSSVRRAGGAGEGLPFTRVEIEDPSQVPYRSHGKVFFRSQGSDWVCSGTVVASESESLVVTAGHCVYEGGFSNNFMFVPAYQSGDAPFGEWTASELFTTSGWSSGNINFDVGMAVMSPKSGETIQDSVGGRGIAFNQDPSTLEFEAIGYPAANPFDGESMFLCTSDFGYRDGTAASAPLAIGCDMTGGSSGGGWVIDGANVNSVVSYGYNELPDVLFGPYFGDAIQTLYESAGGTEPEPEPERVDHEIALTLNLSGHLRATGRMKVPDGYLPCRRNAPVRIFRITGQTAEVFVKKTRTGDDGRYSLDLPDRTGRYYAFGPEGEVNELNNCLDAFSGYARHRH